MEIKIFFIIAILAASCFSVMAKDCRITDTYQKAPSWTVVDVECLVDSKIVSQTRCIRGQWEKGDLLDTWQVLERC